MNKTTKENFEQFHSEFNTILLPTGSRLLTRRPIQLLQEIPDILEATINVASSRGDELRSMVDEVEAFNKMKRGN